MGESNKRYNSRQDFVSELAFTLNNHDIGEDQYLNSSATPLSAQASSSSGMTGATDARRSMPRNGCATMAWTSCSSDREISSLPLILFYSIISCPFQS